MTNKNETQERADFEHWLKTGSAKPFEQERIFELSDEGLEEIAKDALWQGWNARAELDREAPKSAEFLTAGTRYKVGILDDVCCVFGLPAELNGRWVALVAADDNAHLGLSHDN